MAPCIRIEFVPVNSKHEPLADQAAFKLRVEPTTASDKLADKLRSVIPRAGASPALLDHDDCHIDLEELILDLQPTFANEDIQQVIFQRYGAQEHPAGSGNFLMQLKVLVHEQLSAHATACTVPGSSSFTLTTQPPASARQKRRSPPSGASTITEPTSEGNAGQQTVSTAVMNDGFKQSLRFAPKALVRADLMYMSLLFICKPHGYCLPWSQFKDKYKIPKSSQELDWSAVTGYDELQVRYQPAEDNGWQVNVNVHGIMHGVPCVWITNAWMYVRGLLLGF